MKNYRQHNNTENHIKGGCTDLRTYRGGVSQLWSRGRLLDCAINATVAAATAVNKTDSKEILPCRSVMLKQDELAFIKALSTLHRRLATSQKKKKIPTVSAGRRSTPSGSVSRASHRITGKRKANKLASSGDSSEPANRCWVYPSATGEQAASSILQPGSSGVGATYPTVLAATQPRLCQVGR